MGACIPVVPACLGLDFKGHKLALIIFLRGQDFRDQGQDGLEGGCLLFYLLEPHFFELSRGNHVLRSSLEVLILEGLNNTSKGGLGELVGQNFSTCSTCCYKFIMQYAASWPCRENV